MWLFPGLMAGTTADEIAVNGVAARGEVIGHARGQGASYRGGGNREVFPIVAFTDGDGRAQSFTSRVGIGGGRFDVGEAVDVIYLPNDPQRAIIDTFADRHTAHLVGAFAILAILAGILLIRQDRRRHAPANPWRDY